MRKGSPRRGKHRPNAARARDDTWDSHRVPVRWHGSLLPRAGAGEWTQVFPCSRNLVSCILFRHHERQPSDCIWGSGRWPVQSRDSSLFNHRSDVLWFLTPRVPHKQFIHLGPCDRQFVGIAGKHQAPRVLVTVRRSGQGFQAFLQNTATCFRLENFRSDPITKLAPACQMKPGWMYLHAPILSCRQRKSEMGVLY